MLAPFLLVASILTAPFERVDFVYYEGEGERDRDSIEVNFGLHGECAKTGAWLSSVEGVLLTEVRVNGKMVEPRTSRGYRHGWGRMVIEHPGPNFFYHMPLSHLESAAPYDDENSVLYESTWFDVRGLPRRLDITYKIRCADGSTTSKAYVTRGRRLPLPRLIDPHPPKGAGERATAPP